MMSRTSGQNVFLDLTDLRTKPRHKHCDTPQTLLKIAASTIYDRLIRRLIALTDSEFSAPYSGPFADQLFARLNTELNTQVEKKRCSATINEKTGARTPSLPNHLRENNFDTYESYFVKILRPMLIHHTLSAGSPLRVSLKATVQWMIENRVDTSLIETTGFTCFDFHHLDCINKEIGDEHEFDIQILHRYFRVPSDENFNLLVEYCLLPVIIEDFYLIKEKTFTANVIANCSVCNNFYPAILSARANGICSQSCATRASNTSRNPKIKAKCQEPRVK